MDDPSISPDQASDTQTSEVELPISVDDLAIDGVAPEPGDRVNVEMSATVTRVINAIAWLKPTELEHKPLPDTPIEKDPDMSELDRAYNMSRQTGTTSSDSGY